MAILSAAAIYYESAQSQQSFAALTDSGDHITFTLSASKPWSQAAGYEPAICPYGLATGGIVTPYSTNDVVSVAALTAYMPAATGASSTTGLLSVAGGNLTVTRGTGGNAYCITSLTVNASGALAAVAGTPSTAFTEARGAAGGPPFIPVGSIEIGQVRTTSITAGLILSTEIFQVVGTHQERYDFPVFTPDYLRGQIAFSGALPLIHTGSVAKAVYARVATPVFAEISRAKDWKPAADTHSAGSEQFYDGTVGSFSSSLSQAGFTCSLGDGITDALLGKAGQNLIFKFKADKNKTPYQLTQGVLGVATAYPVGGSPTATCTVTAQQASVNLAS